MNQSGEYSDVATRLWQEHLDAAFPARLRGVELAGIDMVMLDSDIAGCVSTWHRNDGSPDAKRLRILRQCLANLDEVLPLLTEKLELEYFGRLRKLATLAITRW